MSAIAKKPKAARTRAGREGPRESAEDLAKAACALKRAMTSFALAQLRDVHDRRMADAVDRFLASRPWTGSDEDMDALDEFLELAFRVETFSDALLVLAGSCTEEALAGSCASREYDLAEAVLVAARTALLHQGWKEIQRRGRSGDVRVRLNFAAGA